MKKQLLSLFLATGTLASLSTVATAEVTAPVGYVKLTFNSTADTPFSLPLDRPKVYTGQASAISGNLLSVSATDFTTDQYKYVNNTQNEHYYVLFTTGALEGRSFDIGSNTTNGITVETEVEEIGQPAPTLQSLGALANDRFVIRPHWSLGTLFPSNSNFPKNSSTSDPAGLISFRPKHVIGTTNNASGTDIAPVESYFYFDHATNDSLDGWYKFGSTGLGKMDNFKLERGTFYIARNKTGAAATINVTGDVPLVDGNNKVRINLVEQDNYVSLSFPVEVTLAGCDLLTSGFAKSTTTGSPDGDKLLTYEGATGYDPSPTKTYFYFDHASNNALDGWYIQGATGLGKQDTEAIFKPGHGYIIRKAASTTTDEYIKWGTTLPYLPFNEAP